MTITITFFTTIFKFFKVKSISKKQIQTEKTIVIPKTTRYRTWKLARIAVTDNNNAEISDTSEIIEKLKKEKQKKIYFANFSKANISRSLTLEITNLTFKHQVVKNLKFNKFQSNQPVHIKKLDISTIAQSIDKTGLQYEEIFVKNFQEGRINLSFKNMIRISSLFIKICVKL